MRIEGFGGSRATMYVGSPGIFQGLVLNGFTFSVESFATPTSHLVYSKAEEITGFVLDGEHITHANLQGDGTMEGRIAFQIDGSADRTDVVAAGTLDYRNLQLAGGIPVGGTYTLALETGEVYELPHTLATDLDLHAILPEEL